MKKIAVLPRLACVVALACLALPAPAMSLRLSSIGYHPQGAKVAFLQDVPEGQKVEVVLYDPNRRNPKFPVLLGAPMFKVENVREIEDKGQQGPATRNFLIDFSDFKLPGSYELHVEGTPLKSEPLKISEFLYWDTLKPVVRTFYFQRCGQEVEDKNIPIFHAACHTRDADFVTPGKVQDEGEDGIDVVGGWHNGGDYAKYVTSTALSAARLMAMHEWNNKPFKSFRLDYPLFEPGYGATDDLHHEIKAGLDWLMTMQRRDGALYRKVAGKQWPKAGKPENDEQQRYVYGVSTQDTANAAAAWAIAARDFKKADLGYSVKSLLAAEKAWTFLEARTETLVQHSDSDFSGSGEFIDAKAESDTPYRLWAAAELYVTTGKEKYQRYFTQHIGEISLQRFSWTNPAFQGVTDYLFYCKTQDARTTATLKAALLKLADTYVASAAADVYGVGLSQFGFSSNQEVAERGAVMLAAYRASGDIRYRDAASRLTGYFFGLNPLGKTYLTGFTPTAVNHPHHRWMEAAGKVLPAFLVDGPNEFATDGKTPKGRGAASYVDEADARSVNESKLLNNAALAYLLAVLNDSYNVSADSGAIGAPKSPLDFQLAPERPGSGKGKKK